MSGFADPAHDMLPPIVPAWREALLQVDMNKDRCHSCAKVAGINGLSFPHPDLFMSIENVDKQNSCWHAWLRLRGAMLARLAVPDYLPPTFLHQEWQALLMLSYLWDSGNTGSKKAQL